MLLYHLHRYSTVYSQSLSLCVCYLIHQPWCSVDRRVLEVKPQQVPRSRGGQLSSPQRSCCCFDLPSLRITDQRWQVRQNCYNAATNPRRPLIGRLAPPGPMGGGGRGLLTNGRGVANIWLQFLVVIGWAGLGWAGLGWAGRRAAVTSVGSRHQKLSLPTTLAWHGAAAPSRGNHTRHHHVPYSRYLLELETKKISQSQLNCLLALSTRRSPSL